MINWDTADITLMQQFARMDDCVATMVPSDLRQILGRLARAEAKQDAPADALLLDAERKPKRTAPAFPRPAVGAELVGEQDGMSLRDWFATVVDKDEYGDLITKHLTRETGEQLAGPYPTEPQHSSNKALPAPPEERVRWRLACLMWEFRVRAALRYMMADAMVVERAL